MEPLDSFEIAPDGVTSEQGSSKRNPNGVVDEASFDLYFLFQADEIPPPRHADAQPHPGQLLSGQQGQIAEGQETPGGFALTS